MICCLFGVAGLIMLLAAKEAAFTSTSTSSASATTRPLPETTILKRYLAGEKIQVNEVWFTGPMVTSGRVQYSAEELGLPFGEVQAAIRQAVVVRDRPTSAALAEKPQAAR